MATLTIFQPFKADIANKVHNLATDQLTVALTNTAPNVANGVLADITEISYTNLSTRNLTTTSSTQTTGTYALVLEDLTLTASGTIPEFRYIVVYNSTTASNNLIGFFDNGSGVELIDGQQFKIDFQDSQTLFDIT